MLSLGIDRQRGFVYEGNGTYGHAIWPSPVVTSAKFWFASDGPREAEKSTDSLRDSCRFREDFFDPISRVRRGRFYFAGGTQPQVWYVQPHPGMSSVRSSEGIDLHLETFFSQPVRSAFEFDGRNLPLVLLGQDERFTLWSILSIEAISTGEDLVTLKARSSFGILPELDDSKIPQEYRSAVQSNFDALLDEVYRAAPTSVIDRARDTASQVLLAYLATERNQLTDLAKQARELEQSGKIVPASAAKIIARLHARAKPTERAIREMRPIGEHDAELAIQCLGLILCEVGWANWA